MIPLTRMKRNRRVCPFDNVIEVDVGCILSRVQDAAAEADRLFPLSLAAEGSCTIDGNLTTNAGGTAVLRYGNARHLCRGLEVVLSSGEIWPGMHSLRKDNSGYDLRGFLYRFGRHAWNYHWCGATPVLAAQIFQTAMVAVPTPASAVTLLEQIRSTFEDQLTTFELMSRSSMRIVLEHRPALKKPLQTDSGWYVLIELSEFHTTIDAAALLEDLLASAMEDGVVTDATIAASEQHRANFWSLREGISEAQGALGPSIKHDIAVPVARIPAFLAQADGEILSRWPNLRLIAFGHMGDGNIHYNLSPPPGMPKDAFVHISRPSMPQFMMLSRRTTDPVGGARVGTATASGGSAIHAPVELPMMNAIKSALDPRELMKPDKLIGNVPTDG